jgi:uncharacterized cupin superfamily protein
MADILVMKTKGKHAPDADKGKPDKEKLIKGKYETRTWNHFTGEDDRLFCGIWESTRGNVKVDYSEWEFCHIIEGKAVLTNEDGKSWTVEKGDGFIIPAGFKGTWETVKKVKKHYVILLPKPAK